MAEAAGLATRWVRRPDGQPIDPNFADIDVNENKFVFLLTHPS